MGDPRRKRTKKRNGTSARSVAPVLKADDREDRGDRERPVPQEAVEESPETVQDDPRGERPHDREREQLRERILRLQAEFDNYRKRQARDFRKLCLQGKKDLIRELLSVLDNYHRAEKLVTEGGHSVEEIADGLLKTSEQLTAILAQEGLRELEVGKGDAFDPNVHEAMLAEDAEGLDRDTVLEVFQRGYLMGDELLRPARVRVGRADGQSRREDPDPEGGE